MSRSDADLISTRGVVVARVSVEESNHHFGGVIDLTDTPADLRELFAEHERFVNDQCFTHADQVQRQIDEYALRVRFADGSAFAANDLQVYPDDGAVSFRSPEMWARFQEDMARRRYSPEPALTTPTPGDPNADGRPA